MGFSNRIASALPNMITYETKLKNKKAHALRVLLDGKQVGEIRMFSGCFQYFPNGSSSGGEIFNTLEECKKSLE